MTEVTRAFGDRLLLQPPEILEINEPVIFLAGPIQGAPDWQSEATRIIHDIDPSVVVASPRRDYPEGTFVYEKQVDWETHFLRAAGRTGAVGFWLARQAVETPGRAYAQTTRFELGEWKMRHERDGVKLSLGIEGGFGNARYYRHRFGQDCPNVPISETLEDMCINAIRLLNSEEK